VNKQIRWGALARYCVSSCLLMTGVPAFAQKTDIVEFGHGSRLVGEVKSLDRGKLYFKTDATDTITIDWADVTRLVTTQRIRVETRAGKRYFGALDATGANDSLAVTSGDGTVAVPLRETVILDPIEATVADRIDFDTSIGYGFTKSTGVEQLDFEADLRYDTELVSRELQLTSQSSSSDEVERSTRNVASYRAIRLHENRWFTGWLGKYESNDALALDYRFSGALIGGRSFFPSADRRLRAFGGLAVNDEQFKDNTSQQSLEGVVGGIVDWFYYDEPELDLNSTLTLFPSITESGRVRGNLNVSLRWEIFKDLFWKLSLYNDYDSRPQGQTNDANPPNNDYGVTTGLGWSW